jgi:hypothetical protein
MMTDTLAEFLAGKVPGRQVLVHNAHSTQIGERLPGVLKRHSMRLNGIFEFTHVTDIAPIYGLTGVFLCAEEVERNIILITENPAIVPRRDVKQIAGSHFDN